MLYWLSCLFVCVIWRQFVQIVNRHSVNVFVTFERQTLLPRIYRKCLPYGSNIRIICILLQSVDFLQVILEKHLIFQLLHRSKSYFRRNYVRNAYGISICWSCAWSDLQGVWILWNKIWGAECCFTSVPALLLSSWHLKWSSEWLTINHSVHILMYAMSKFKLSFWKALNYSGLLAGGTDAGEVLSQEHPNDFVYCVLLW